MTSLSAMPVPVFLDTNTDAAHMLRQWVRMYHYGHIYMPALCVATCGIYAYAARDSRACSLRYALAAAVTLAMVPFTWLFMAPTNSTLFRLEEEASWGGSGIEGTGAAVGVAQLGYVQELVVRWGWLHLARCLFPVAGAALGWTGIMKETGV